MKAFILAAGKGTRLQPFTDKLPKVLVPVLGTAMLDRLVAGLKRHGAGPIALNTHHFADIIEEHVIRTWSSDGATPRRFHEPELLGTGGALANAAAFWDAPVLLWNGDILADVDVAGLWASHAATGADATMVVSDRSASSHLQVDGTGWMCGIHSPRRNVNRAVREANGMLRNLAYHGVAIFGPRLVQQMARPGAFDLIEALLQAIEEGAKVQTFHAGDGFWGTTGSLAELQRLEQSLQQNPHVLTWFTP
jgi:NDP-sugar pyrophosphorylase family protein